ncbi:Uma2 family endonuclease [Nocardioides sp. CBS4Y-1]|uniref:Uma2 family endonuclease n=1 Tax=Nocardioides acrostichi TaxID=2784339 RepID=A0A930YAF6_9ACTN|nr:Uma2 family endonuclease [Nocardioides acrostichi]
MEVAEEPLRRFRMSWEEYLRLPDDARAEFVDGEVVVSPRPSHRHGVVVGRLMRAPMQALPDLEVVPEAGLRLPGDRLRGPDIAVFDAVQSTTFAEEPPVLVVEVLSPSTRTEDTVRKPMEYASADIAQLWLADPELRRLDVLDLVDGAWEPVLALDDDHPAGEVTVGEHGVVRLELADVLPPAAG